MAFKRYGRSLQLRIRKPQDLVDVLRLDDARWAATGAPLDGINLDPRFLQLVDTDDNRRIMVFEVRSAVSWALDVFAEPAVLVEPADSIGLDSIRSRSELPSEISGRDKPPVSGSGGGSSSGAVGGPDAGRPPERHRAVAGETGLPSPPEVEHALAQVLTACGKPMDQTVSLAEVRSLAAEVANRPVSASGVILPEAVADIESRRYMEDAIRVTHGTLHPSGVAGLDPALSARFSEQAGEFLEWQASAPVRVGNETAEAYRLFQRLADRIDQFFLVCRAGSLDVRLSERAYPSDAELAALDLTDRTALKALLERMPMVSPDAAKDAGCRLCAPAVSNPEYAEDFRSFLQLARGDRSETDAPELDEKEWRSMRGYFDSYGGWMAKRPELDYGELDPVLVEMYARGDMHARFVALVEDATRGILSLSEVETVERVLLVQLHLFRFVNSFVSFPELYDNSARATFEMGSLVMDGRYFHLAVLVPDHARHVRIARSSNMYLMYVVVRTSEGNPQYEIAVPVTSGRAGNLCVGKRGVFHDVLGNEFDAEVTQILENPVSIGEALLLPFQRVGSMITSKIESLSRDSEKRLDAVTGGAVGTVYSNAQSSAAAGASQAPTAARLSGSTAVTGGAGSANAVQPGQATGTVAGVGGLLAGGGVALAAIGSAIAYLTATLAKLPWWQILIGIFGAVLAVLIPTTIIAILKLSRRDLSAILEGSGWAVNARMRLTPRLSRFFTQRPRRKFDVPEILRKTAPH